MRDLLRNSLFMITLGLLVFTSACNRELSPQQAYEMCIGIAPKMSKSQNAVGKAMEQAMFQAICEKLKTSCELDSKGEACNKLKKAVVKMSKQ